MTPDESNQTSTQFDVLEVTLRQQSRVLQQTIDDVKSLQKEMRTLLELVAAGKAVVKTLAIIGTVVVSIVSAAAWLYDKLPSRN